MAETVEQDTYTWAGAGGPFSVTIAPGVFAPSSTSRVLGDSLRVRPGDTVLDAGCGSGVLSFVAAFLGAGRVIGSDVSPAAVDCAMANADRLGLGAVTEFRCGPLFEPVPDIRADVVIADISGVPDAVAAATGWFPDGRGGGPTGAELPVAMLSGIGEQLAPGGHVYLPTGTLQDEPTVLRAARDVFGDRMEPVATREFPLPEVVERADGVADLITEGVITPRRRGSRLFWRLTVWRCAAREGVDV